MGPPVTPRCVHKGAFGRAGHNAGHGVAGLQQQTCASQFWGPEAQNPGVGRAEFSLNALEMTRTLSSWLAGSCRPSLVFLGLSLYHPSFMSARYWGFPHVCFPPESPGYRTVLGLLYFTLNYICTDSLSVHRYRLGVQQILGTTALLITHTVG